MKKALKTAGFTFGGVAGFALLYFGVEWCCARIAVPAEKGQPQEVAIFIKTNHAHTDIVVPVSDQAMDWSKALPYSNNISPDTTYNYLGIGWGDKGFFLDMPTWGDLTFRIGFNALFWLNTTAMHATYYKDMEEDETCRRIMISREQYVRLVDFITGRFTKDDRGGFINIKTDAVYGVDDAFYEARGRYNLFYTCNTWANCALASCGQRHCLWTAFYKGIFLMYE